MKTGVHPEYHHDTKVSCACGNTFVTGSTETELKVEMCSNCHPFYTGKQKLIDTAGRVDRFKRIQERTKVASTKHTEVKAAKATRVAARAKAKTPKKVAEV